MEKPKYFDHFFSMVQKGHGHNLREFIRRKGQQVAFQLASSYNENNETPLLIAVKNGSLVIVDILKSEAKADIGQTGRFEYQHFYCEETPPLLAAIITNKRRIIESLTEAHPHPELSVDAILSSYLPPKDKIDALEMMGVVFAFARTSNCHQLGFQCWKEAMRLRCECDFPKNPGYQSEQMRQLTGNSSELTTIDELESFRTSSNRRQQLQQALLVNQRIATETILGSDAFSFDVISQFISKCLNGSPLDYPMEVNNGALLLMELYAKMKERCFETIYSILARAVKYLTNYLSLIVQDYQRNLKNDKIVLVNVMDMISFMNRRGHLRNIRSRPELYRSEDDRIRSALNLIQVLVRFCPILDDSERQIHMKSLKTFISSHQMWAGKQMSLLHQACILRPFVSDDLIQTLLDVGVDPNACDSNGNSVLHYLADNIWTDMGDRATRLLQIIVSGGGKIDHVNNIGLSARDNIKFRFAMCPTLKHDPTLNYILQGNVLTLKKSCVKKINEHHLDISELPLALKIGFLNC